MKALKLILILFSIFLVNNKISAQRNDLTLIEYSNIKINNVIFQEISNTDGDITLMQNLFGNEFTVESGYNDAIDYWIKFSTNSLCIEFYHGKENNSTIKYDLANVQIVSSGSNFTIKGHIITIGDSINVFSNSQTRTYGGKKMLLFGKQDFDSYIYIRVNPTSNLITKIGFNGNLL